MPTDKPLSFRLEELYQLFGDTTWPRYEVVPAEIVPPPYDRLLVHHEHMTVTMEAYHGGPVSLRVLARRRQESWYGRKILLLRNERVVQFGIMRIHLGMCAAEVQQAILREDTPLGHILIRHNVLRYIEPLAFLRLTPDPALCTWFGLSRPCETYGRLAAIYCNHLPAVELFEVSAPVLADSEAR
ncbi:MAG: hypothetical protein NZM42_06550 [Gemmatales bacterium]|nr:hypothetical protein [Gemmatales bacterium]MCS7167422.1 hypothetical protein [Gemmatales bacterium]MDW8223049.1 hypothetical protein [Gemmatales bacterium]